MKYGRFGKMMTKPGQRDQIVKLLLRDFEEMKEIGCEIYLVNISEEQPDAIWVTEVWSSREAHGQSLKLPSVRAAIQEAMPSLTGEFESVELQVVGGLGVSQSPA